MTNPEHPNPDHPDFKPGTPRRAQPEQGNEPTPDDQRRTALAAFSTLVGVSTNPDERAEQFFDAYVGSWSDRAQMIRDITGIGTVEDAINQMGLDLPTGRFIHIDYQALEELIAERFDIVEQDGIFHIFEK